MRRIRPAAARPARRAGQEPCRFGVALGRQVPGRRSHALPDPRPRGLPAAAAAWPGGGGRSRGGRTARQRDSSPATASSASPIRRTRISIETARGLGNLSRNLAIPGHQAFGSYAQYLVRDEKHVAAAAGRRRLRAGGRCALAVLVVAPRSCATGCKVRPGDNVLITGASGGMGQATLQLAKLAGARVIATTRHAAKAAMLREARRRRRGRQRRRGRWRPRRCAS